MIILWDKDGTLCELPIMEGCKALFPGTEEERLIHIANAQLPDGTRYEVSPFSDPVDIEDRTVGSDWTYKSTARERISVALNESDQTTYNNTVQAWLDAGRDGDPI